MGTIINTAAIIVASFLGVFLKKGLPEKMQKAVMVSLGLGLTALSLGWFLQDFLVVSSTGITTQYDLLIIVSLVIGVLVGEWIDIDHRLNTWAENFEKKHHLPPLARGFIAATMIFCVGAMAIVGSIKDGLTGDITTLLIKSALDFVTAMILASVLGIGVVFSAISVFVYQGAITLLAMLGGDLLSPEIIQTMSMVGNILLIAIGINFMELRRIKVANMLPALLIPILYFLIISII